MDSSNEARDFVEKNISHHDCILIGCRADDDVNVHECCEYNIIALDHSHNSSQAPLYFDDHEKNLREYKRTFQIRVLTASDFHNNIFIRYSDFVYLPGKFLRNTEFDHFKEKYKNLRRNLRFEIRRELFDNIYSLTFLLNYLSKGIMDEKAISFELKMISLRTLRNYIHFYLSKEHRPSHLKSQINSVIQSESIKVRERIDSILESIGMQNANISALNRSENSLKLLMGNTLSPTKKLLLEKVEFLKKKSMYVDAVFLIYNYILDNFQRQEQKASYPQLLRRATDIDNKEKMSLKKQIELIIEYNKLLI